jgi:hypothetical protein
MLLAAAASAEKAFKRIVAAKDITEMREEYHPCYISATVSSSVSSAKSLGDQNWSLALLFTREYAQHQRMLQQLP